MIAWPWYWTGDALIKLHLGCTFYSKGMYIEPLVKQSRLFVQCAMYCHLLLEYSVILSIPSDVKYCITCSFIYNAGYCDLDLPCDKKWEDMEQNRSTTHHHSSKNIQFDSYIQENWSGMYIFEYIRIRSGFITSIQGANEVCTEERLLSLFEVCDNNRLECYMDSN